MSFGERGSGFIQKSPEALGEQLERAQEKIGAQPEHSLVPPSKDAMGGGLREMSLSEIKQKYARRYEIYLKLLRAQQREGEGEPVLTEYDIVEMQKWLKGLNALDSYIAAHKTGETEILRERQVPIFEDLRDYIEQGGKAGYVKLPTGVGKTVLFTELIEALDFKTLIVVPTTPLVEQTEERLEEFAPDLDVEKIYGYAKEHGRQVTIITYDSFVSQVRDEKINPEDYDCLILDEAHTALSEKRSDTVRQFKDTLKIGFTATPAYSENKKVSNILPDQIHTMAVREAVEEGLLCSFSAMVARTEVDLSKVRLTSSGEYDEDQLAKAVNIASRNQSAVDLYKKQFNGETSVAYCVNIKHAEAVARMFNAQGVRAEVISGHTSRAEQKRIKAEFKQGKIKVLCNADILIPGFDEPRASVCLNLRPTRSRVIAEQRGGRVLRTNRRAPNKHAYIVDFIDRGIDEKRPPILFADVAEGAQFSPKKKGLRQGGGVGGGGKPPTPIMDIPGLEVITDTEEVMRIVKKYREVKDKSVYPIFEDFKNQVRVAQIRSVSHYESVYTEHAGWPSHPQRTYAGQWPGWKEILVKESKYPLFEELKSKVHVAGIKNFIHYNRAYKAFGWPSNPNRVYAAQWPGWDEFLGKEKKKRPEFLQFENLQKLVRLMEVKNSKDYILLSQQMPDWPSAPAKVYVKEWPGWEIFLGTEIEWLPFDQLMAEVRAEGIMSSKHYQKVYSTHRGWSSQPYATYADQWPGWPEFLGKKK